MPSPQDLSRTPVRISNDLLHAGLTTWERHEKDGRVTFKRDEILRKQVPSNACHGLHFIAGEEQGKKVICYARCASSYVTTTGRPARA